MKNSENTTTRIYITVEEKRLLEKFRTLTPEEKRRVLTIARKLAERD